MDPVDDEIAWYAYAVADENFRLSVEREVIDVFPDEQVGEEPGGE